MRPSRTTRDFSNRLLDGVQPHNRRQPKNPRRTSTICSASPPTSRLMPPRTHLRISQRTPPRMLPRTSLRLPRSRKAEQKKSTNPKRRKSLSTTPRTTSTRKTNPTTCRQSAISFQPGSAESLSKAVLIADRATFRRVEFVIDTTVEKIHATVDLESSLGDRQRDGR